MKKLIFLLAIAFTFSNAMAQTAWTTMYKVAPENMQAAKDAIGKKTKKFNSKADGELIYTFQILAGERANYIVREGLGNSYAELDSYGNQGLDYWMENVAPLMENVGGTEYMSYVPSASFDDRPNDTKKIWKVIHYNVKRTAGPDFWKFRNRVAKAAEKVGNLSLHVWAGSIGGAPGHVKVGFGNADMSGIDNESVVWPNIVAAYNELFEDSFEEDSKAFNESLTAWGNFVEIWRWLPELSSPAVDLD